MGYFMNYATFNRNVRCIFGTDLLADSYDNSIVEHIFGM